MKLFGLTINSPVRLLPLTTAQRHLLSGVSGLLVWIAVSVWPRNDETYWGPAWNWAEPAPLLNSLGYHFSRTIQDLEYAFYQPYVAGGWSSPLWFDILSAIIQVIGALLPAILSIALLVAGVTMILGAYNIVSYPPRLRRFPPLVLGSTLVLMLLTQVIARPAFAIIRVAFPEYQSVPVKFSFDPTSWALDLTAICINLAIPAAILLIALIPAFAPEKKK